MPKTDYRPRWSDRQKFSMQKTNMKVLFCGPWVRDFGWELCWFNPCAREKWRYLKPDFTIVQAPRASRHLYEFADRFMPIDVDTEATETHGQSFMASWEKKENVPGTWVHFCPSDESFLDWSKNEIQIHSTPREDHIERDLKKKFFGRMWRDLRPEADKQQQVADVMCAFVSPKPGGDHAGHNRSYPQEEANDLVHRIQDLGYSVACYGGPSNLYVEGTKDLRYLPLDLQCGALAKAKVAVGPSSATMHLAALCHVPTVTWYSCDSPAYRRMLQYRYHDYWNPFHVPVRFIHVNGVIAPELVANNTRSMVERNRDG